MSKHYFVGSGIASLAGAAFLIRDAAVRGQDIVIFEAAPGFGGALAADGSAASGYRMYGNRIFAGQYACTFDLMGSIPSVSNPHISVNEESALASGGRQLAHVRLLDSGRHGAVDRSNALAEHYREGLVQLLAASEGELLGKRISDCFDEHFFDTAFWLEWSTTFALRRWHSAVEWRRYLRRQAGQLAGPAGPSDISRTLYSPYECLAMPLQRWLAGQGVEFRFRTAVADMALAQAGEGWQVEALHLVQDGQPVWLPVAADDRVFATLGAMATGATFGSMIEPAPLAPTPPAEADGWALWRALAARRPDLGRPQAFSGDVDASQWTSFTVTTDDPAFAASLARLRGESGEQTQIIRLNRSGWLLTLALYDQPFFMEQPDVATVWWGYGLAHDRPGDFIRKPLRECHGTEILEEVLYQLQCPQREREAIMASSNCIPCTLPYVTSPFLVRAQGDRPLPVPAGSRNLGLLGQYVELADEVTWTVEYSVRSAQKAVYALLGVERPLPSVREVDESPEAILARLVEAALWTP
jgi:oleate hydratase